MSEKYGLPVSTPEAQGLSSRAILAFIDEIEAEHIELQSLILMRHGHIISEGYWAPFGPGKPHRMFSSAKALVATAILFAIQEGLLHLEDHLTEFFPDKITSQQAENLQKLTYYHMLSMTTGHAADYFTEMLQAGADRPAVFFQKEFRYEPGTHFLYDNGVPDMLALTIHRITDMTILEFLQPRLIEPLGMKSFRADMYGPEVELISLCCSTGDLFKLTRFYYQNGAWEGKQLLDEKLARMACSYQVSSLQDPEPPAVAYDTKFGYGFQIWRNSVGGFRIDGGRGQFGIGIPEMDLVACMNSNESDQNIIPVLFWKHITNRLYARPIKEDSETFNLLSQKLSSLTSAPIKSESPSADFSGTYRFDSDFLGRDRISLRFQDDDMKLTGYSGDRSFGPITSRPSEWHTGSSPFFFPEIVGSSDFNQKPVPGMDPTIVFTSGHWIETNKYELAFRSDAWLGAHFLTLVFSNEGLVVTDENAASFTIRHRSPSIRPVVLGSRELLLAGTATARKID